MHVRSTSPAPSPHRPNGWAQASSAHAQLASPPHSSGIGRHVCSLRNASFLTHSSSSGHDLQSGTLSHDTAGTHAPLQHASLMPGSVPGGHSGGSESQTTSLLQSTFSVVHWPSTHTAWSMPICSHCVWSHRDLQIGSF
jgi:hypothetical protein